MDTFITITPAGSYSGLASYRPVVVKLMGHATYAPMGSGGWQVVDRPKSTAATQWFDRAPFQLSFEGILDGESHTQPESQNFVDNSCVQIESWLKAVPGLTQPPVFNISGPVPGTEKYWVLFNVEFTDAIRDIVSGSRVTQNVRITLYEYVPPLGRGYTMFGLTPSSEFVSNNTNSSTVVQTSKTYTVKKGDTLQKIANANRKKLTVYAYVAAIKNLNKIRDNAQLTTLVGKKIKIPVG